MYPCKTPCGDIDCLNSCIHSKKGIKKMATYDLVKTITMYFNSVEALSEADAIALVDGKGIFDADSYGDTNTFVLWSSEEEYIR